MEWFLSPNQHDATLLRCDIRDHLERHARAGADIAGAELVISELLTNAVEHAGSKIWVSLDWGSKWPVLTVCDLGPGFDLDALPVPIEVENRSGRGLMIATALSREIKTRLRPSGGTSTSAVLEIERDLAADIDPDPRPERHGLPRLDEANPTGYFGRESYLKALAVEVADAVEADLGPDVAERTIAQVGATVGRQMETAYRNQHRLHEALTPEQIVELYIGLKTEIGGSYSVVSISDDKIVLDNSVCPFGEAVQSTPSLCRMTTSVLGGIAARNGATEVAVQLSARIAVGDPHCRVVVWLTPPPSEVEPYVHRFSGRADDSEAPASASPAPSGGCCGGSCGA